MSESNGPELIHEIDDAPYDAVAAELGPMVHAAAFGEIVSLLMASPAHRETKVGDLARFVSPAIATRQYVVAKAQRKNLSSAPLPVGAAFWASVSAEVDARLRAAQNAPVSLALEEWKSGDVLWLVDLVAVDAVRAAMLRDLDRRVGAGRPIYVKTRDAAGVFRVETVSDILARA